MSRRSAVVTGLALLGTWAALVAGALALRRVSTARLRRPGVGPGVVADDGVLLHAQQEGRADAALTVVLSHGFASGAGTFEPQREHLGRRARVLVMEHRGHRRSGWSGRWDTDLGRLGRDLADIVGACPEGPVVLVGHSMGAIAVLELARQHPRLFGGRVRGVALLSGSSGRRTPRGPLRSAWRVVERVAGSRAVAAAAWLLGPVLDGVDPVARRLPRRVVGRVFFGHDDVDEATWQELRRMWRETSHAKVDQLAPRALSVVEDTALDVVARVPVLVLAGTADPVFPAAGAVRTARRIGDAARLVLLEGAGHMVTLSRPGEVREALDELLDRVDVTVGAAT